MKIKKIIPMIIAALVVSIAIPIKSEIPELNSTSYTRSSETHDPILKSDIVKITAVGDHRNFGWMDGHTIDFEGFFGIRIDTSDSSNPKYSVYTHNPMFVCKSIEFDGKSLTDMTVDEWYPLDIKGLQDDVYDITLTFETAKGDKMHVYGYFGVSDSKAYTCRKLDDINEYTSQKSMECLMRDVDPKDYLSTEELCYPTLNSYHCVKGFQKLADEIAKPTWTDEAKVFAFVKYITENYAYDAYKIRKGTSRASMANDYNDPNNFAYKNNVGVCWDYTNMLAIMCRQHGIPCTSLDNKIHTVNAVYLNGEWIAIDVTALAIYECDSLDTSRENWYKAGKANWNKYGYYENSMPYVNYEIWTWKTNPEAYESKSRPKVCK